MLARYTPLRRTAFKRKPPKTRVVVHEDGRERLEGEAWQERRRECHDRAGGRCECFCGRLAPLHDVKDAAGNVVTKAGEAHHRRKRGMGGGFRDDRLENLRWLSHVCHAREHEPKKVVPKKPVVEG